MAKISTQDTPLVDVLVGKERLQNYVELVRPDPRGSVFPFIFNVRDFLPERVGALKAQLKQEFYRMGGGDGESCGTTNPQALIDAEIERAFDALKEQCKTKFAKYGTFDEQGNLTSIQLPKEVVAREREAGEMIRRVARKLPVVFQSEVPRSPKFVFVDGDTIASIWPEPAVGSSSGYTYSHNMHEGSDYVLLAFPSRSSNSFVRPESNLAHELTHAVKLDELAAADPAVEAAMMADTKRLKGIEGELLVAMIAESSKAKAILKENGLLADAKNFSGLPQWQKDLVGHRHKAGFFKALNSDQLSGPAAEAMGDYAERVQEIIHGVLQVLPHSVEGKAELYKKTGQNPADEAMPVLASLVAMQGVEMAKAILPQTFEAATKALEAHGIQPFESRIGMGGSGAGGGMPGRR